MLAKVRSALSAFMQEAVNIYPVKGAAIRFQGAGASNPSVVTSYNCTVARNAAGVYRVTVTNSTAFGSALQTYGVKTVSHLIAPTATTDLYDVQITIVSATQFDVKVYTIVQGAGTTLTRAAYDIVAGDFIDFAILVNAGAGVLPPG